MPESRPGAVATAIPGTDLICILGGGWSGACDLCFDAKAEKWLSLRAEKPPPPPASGGPQEPPPQQQQQQQQQDSSSRPSSEAEDFRRRVRRERDRGAVGRRGHVAFAL